ncbi:MAG: biotin/lipoyl-binding carrier protein [Arachnia sp.]
MNHVVHAEIVANVLAVLVDPGQKVAAGEAVVMLESMKMEIPVLTEAEGVVEEIVVKPGDVVYEGEPLVVLAEGS